MPSSEPILDPASTDGRPRGLWREFMRYAVVGGVAFLADFGVLQLGLYLGLHYLWATAAGFVVGLVVNYLLCVSWAWRGTRATTSRDFLVFSLVGLGGLGLTELLMRLAVGWAGMPPQLAKLPITAVVFLWNFALRRMLVFFR